MTQTTSLSVFLKRFSDGLVSAGGPKIHFKVHRRNTAEKMVRESSVMLCASLFALPVQYKPFSLYLDGFLDIAEHVEGSKTGACLCLFLDADVAKRPEWPAAEVAKMKRTCVVEYRAEADKDPGPVLGMLMRLLPGMHEGTVPAVSVDLDDVSVTLDVTRQTKKLVDWNYGLLLAQPHCYFTNARLELLENIPKEFTNRVVGACLWMGRAAPIELMIEFLVEVYDENAPHGVWRTSVQNAAPSKYENNAVSATSGTPLIFGSDEFFMNDRLLPWHVKNGSSVAGVFGHRPKDLFKLFEKHVARDDKLMTQLKTALASRDKSDVLKFLSANEKKLGKNPVGCVREILTNDIHKVVELGKNKKTHKTRRILEIGWFQRRFSFRTRQSCLDSATKYPVFKTVTTEKELEKVLSSVPPEASVAASPATRKRASSSVPKALSRVSLRKVDPERQKAIESCRFVFRRHKIGILVAIRNGTLAVFRPFSNVDYKNDLTEAQVDALEGQKKLWEKNWLNEPREWYRDGCVLRPGKKWKHNTPDWYHAEYRYLLERMLDVHPDTPDATFVINYSNFPTSEAPVPDAPILSSFLRKDSPGGFIPSGYDIQMATGRFFLGNSRSACSDMFPRYPDGDAPFSEKKPKAVWRGALSTCETSRDVSCRMKIASLGSPSVDAGITSFQTNLPRAHKGEAFLPRAAGVPVPPMTRADMHANRFVVVLGGTNTNASLPYSMQSSSVVVFGGDDGYDMWYSDAMEPWKHYVPLDCQADASDMRAFFDALVRESETAAGQKKFSDIARHARSFYRDYMDLDVMAEYLYRVLGN
nr:Glycosyl transferase family 90 [Oceanusvirus sp.]